MANYTGSLRDTKYNWFAVNGFSSMCLDDSIRAFLVSQLTLGNTNLSLTDLWRTFLKNKGRTEGTVTDMYRAELIASLGGTTSSKSSISDLELMFYSNTANTFA